jgi:hypothetical protein
MDPSPSAEVLGQEPVGSLAGRGFAWSRAHPVLLFLLVVGVVAVAGVVLAGQLRDPQLPTLSVRDGGARSTARVWPVGGDERPSGPVVLAVTATIAASKTGSRLLGISGPGVRKTGDLPVDLSSGPAQTVPLQAVVDCDSVPERIPAGAYGLRVQIRSGARSRTGVVDAGAAGERWRMTIESACAAWSARRNLTASALTARVSPTGPRVALALTLTNSGARPATVTAAHFAPAIGLTGDFPIVVRPHASVKAAVGVAVRRCNDVGDPQSVNFPLSQFFVVTSMINLAGTTGPATPDDGSGTDDGLGSTGIVLDSDSGRTLALALVAACGQLPPPAITPASAAVRYDAGSRLLSVPVTVRTAPGRVRSLRLAAEPVNAQDGGYVPIANAGQELVPDRKGQATTILRFRAPVAGSCRAGGSVLPGVLLSLDVVGLGERRTVVYSEQLDLAPDSHAPALPCGG